MSTIPYNYGKYINDKVSMTDQGVVDAGKQMQSPASAGSRGLAKTTQFTNDRTQMQMGNSPMAESMIEIRNILNRIDGVNAPVQEDEAEDIKTKPKYHIYQHLDHARFVLRNNSYRDSDEYEFHDHGTAIDELIKNKVPGSDTLAQMRQHVPGVDDSEEERNRDLRKMVQIAKDYLINQKNVDDSAMDKPEDSENYKPTQEEESAVQEAQSGITDANYKLLMLDISAMKDRISELNIDDDSKTRALTALGDVEDELNFDEAYEPFPEEDEMTFEDDDAFYEAFGELGFPEDETELFDAEYRGRKVPLNKPMRGDVKKFKVYVKDPKSGNVKKVNFGHGGSSARKAGQKTMKIRKSNPKARKSFRARHNCANPGPKTKARYWSCRKW